MKVTKRMYDLKAGTVIATDNGYIILTSDYNEYHSEYSYHDFEIAENGDLIELETGGYITPVDLIGCEIC